jgi:hypothetical protein
MNKKNITVSLLKNLYWRNELSGREIARKLHVCQQIVYRLMRHYGIRRRSKKEAASTRRFQLKLSHLTMGAKNPHYGKHHSDNTKAILSSQKLGAKNSRWRGGQLHTFNKQARNMWIKYHGPLSRDQVVHHQDGTPKNNSLKNLVLLTNEYHVRLHAFSRRYRIPIEKITVYPENIARLKEIFL